MQHPVPANLRRLATLAAVAAVLAASCSTATQRPSASSTPQPTDLLTGIRVSAADAQAAADSGNALTIDLLQQLELSNPGGNFVDSGFSLAAVLSMLELGARGDTEAQIASVLHSAGVTAEQQAAARKQLDETLLDTASADGISLDAANAIWLQSGLPINAAFLHTLVNDFSAPSSQVDFQDDPQGAANLINHWVSDATHGMIPSVVTPDEIQACIVVLADAVYFDAKWEHQFEAALTYSGAFFRPDNSQVSTAMMQSEPLTLPIYSGDGVTAVELPYVGGQYVADIIMPTSQPLAAFVASLSPGDLTSIERQLASTDNVEVTLPKFDISSQLSLIPILTALGMPDAFGSAADFSGIDGRTDLQISLAKQSSRMQVDEVGTTAAAATVVAIGVSAPLVQVRVVIDHPFLFVIRDLTSGAIIFTAQVTDPTASS
jgi:serpin B